MQDRFKCRVWDKDAKKYLPEYIDNENASMHSYWIGWDDTGVYQYDRDVERDIVFVTDISEFVEIEQCTGLKDKNGKLIYEGDIVVQVYYDGSMSSKAIVKYGEFNCSCCDGVYGWYFDNGDIRNVENYEVIGNIHENADLLENKDE